MKTSKIKKELKEVEYDIKYHCDWCDKDVENDNLYEINDFSLDQKIFHFNHMVADGTIFQSVWVRTKYQIPMAVMWNVAWSSISSAPR